MPCPTTVWDACSITWALTRRQRNKMMHIKEGNSAGAASQDNDQAACPAKRLRRKSPACTTPYGCDKADANITDEKTAVHPHAYGDARHIVEHDTGGAQSSVGTALHDVLAVEVAMESATAIALQPHAHDPRDHGVACPMCPFRRFTHARSMAAHIHGAHIQKVGYVCSGAK